MNRAKLATHIRPCSSLRIGESKPLHLKMSYRQSIYAAITELNDRNGSSMIAIKKKVIDKLPRGKQWLNATFLQALKTGVTAGDLVQIKVSYRYPYALKVLYFMNE